MTNFSSDSCQSDLFTVQSNMSFEDVAAESPAAPPPRDFADLTVLARSWEDIPPAIRSVLLSNIRTVGFAALTSAGHRRGQLGALNRKQIDLRMVPCDVAWLNAHLFLVTPKMLGIKGKGTLGNAISSVRKALRRIGVLDPQEAAVKGGTWRHLLDALTNRGSLYAYGLTAFAGWSDRQGTQPQDVTLDILKRFEAYLTTRTLQSDIPDAISKVAKAWRIARQVMGEWPAVEIKAPVRRTAYVTPLADFAESFQQDVATLMKRISDTRQRGPFRGDGPHRLLRPATVQSRLFSIRQAVTALVLSGRPMGTITSLNDLVQADAFALILRFYWQRAIQARVTSGDFACEEEVPNEAGVTGMTGAIAATLMMLARHHCHLPAGQISVLNEMAKDLTPSRRTQISEKNLARVRQFDDPKARLDLLKMPSVLFKMAEGDTLLLPRRAVLARTGLAIEILLNTPLRIKNLVSLQFGVHLRQDGSRHGRFTHLSIPAHQMKNARTFETVISPELSARIARYQRDFHPALTAEGSTFLFPAGRQRPGHLSVSAMSSQIGSTIAREAGTRMNPHLFRHLAVRFALEDGTGNLEDARQLLGDKDMGVVLANYASVEPAAAARRHHDRLRRARTPGLARTLPLSGKR